MGLKPLRWTLTCNILSNFQSILIHYLKRHKTWHSPINLSVVVNWLLKWHAKLVKELFENSKVQPYCLQTQHVQSTREKCPVVRAKTQTECNETGYNKTVTTSAPKWDCKVLFYYKNKWGLPSITKIIHVHIVTENSQSSQFFKVMFTWFSLAQ